MSLKIKFPNSDQLGSSKEKEVRKIFGLGPSQEQNLLFHDLDLDLNGIIYLTGYSGTGKTSVLNFLKSHHQISKTATANLDSPKKLIDYFDYSVKDNIHWLSLFGLGEAKVLCTEVRRLSVGQKQRLNLAVALKNQPKVIVLDEFLANLDRLSAKVIAFQFQKIVRQLGVIAVVATAHEDLQEALAPDTYLFLDFDGHYQITRTSTPCPKVVERDNISYESGSLADYTALKRFHYMDQGESQVSEDDVVYVATARHREKVVGVRVFTKIYPLAFEKISCFAAINRRAILSSRVVIHPIYRGLGLSKQLDLTTDLKAQFHTVFTHSALANYFPFDQSSGYHLTKHPSSTVTQLQKFYEENLLNLGIDDITKLHDATLQKEFWQNLSLKDQEKLKLIACRVLTDYDLRYYQYICHHLDISYHKKHKDLVQKVFQYINHLSVNDNHQQWLTEPIHFPMQGLVRKLE